MKLLCKACDGVYDDKTSDGLHYYHACPPLSDGRQRPNSRNENATDLLDSAERRLNKRMISEGLGTEQVKE